MERILYRIRYKRTEDKSPKEDAFRAGSTTSHTEQPGGNKTPPRQKSHFPFGAYLEHAHLHLEPPRFQIPPEILPRLPRVLRRSRGGGLRRP